ncbi:MAG TPA: hypothetical protein VGJ20_10395 [Xanthobacteraceae bacterium]|jgi:hypothetical protein
MTPPEPPPNLDETQVKKRRARKLSGPSLMTAAMRKAEKEGKLVKAADVYDDHVTLMFGEDEKVVTPLQAWKAKRNARKTQGR